MFSLYVDINEAFDNYSDYLSIASEQTINEINNNRILVLKELKKNLKITESFCETVVTEISAAVDFITNVYNIFSKIPSRANSRIYYQAINLNRVNDLYSKAYPQKFANEKCPIALNTICDDTIISWPVISRIMTITTFLASSIIKSQMESSAVPSNSNKTDNTTDQYKEIIKRISKVVTKLLNILPVDPTYIPIHIKLLSVLNLIGLSLKTTIFGSCTHILDCISILVTTLRPEKDEKIKKYNEKEGNDGENVQTDDNENDKDFLYEEATPINCAYVLKITPKEAMSQSFIYSSLNDLVFLLNEMLMFSSSKPSFPELSAFIRIRLSDAILKITSSLSDSKIISKFQTTVLSRFVNFYNAIQKQKKGILKARAEIELEPHHINADLNLNEDYVLSNYKLLNSDRKTEKENQPIMVSALVKEAIAEEMSESDSLEFEEEGENEVQLDEPISDNIEKEDNEEGEEMEILTDDDGSWGFGNDDDEESDGNNNKIKDTKDKKASLAAIRKAEAAFKKICGTLN